MEYIFTLEMCIHAYTQRKESLMNGWLMFVFDWLLYVNACIRRCRTLNLLFFGSKSCTVFTCIQNFHVVNFGMSWHSIPN